MFNCQYGGVSYTDEVSENDNTNSVGKEGNREVAKADRLGKSGQKQKPQHLHLWLILSALFMTKLYFFKCLVHFKS